jgi:hypothetical protein
MNDRTTNFGQPTEELEQMLLRCARAEAPSAESRDRALSRASSIAAASAGIGALSVAPKAASFFAAKTGGALATAFGTKSVVVGLATAVLAIGAGTAARHYIDLRASRSAPTVVRPAPEPVAVVPAPRAAPKPPDVTPALSATPAPTAPASRSEPAIRVGHVAARPIPEQTPSDEAAASPVEASLTPAPASSLAKEVAALEPVRHALESGAPLGALALLDRYRTEFPRGRLTEEAAALRVEALASAGRRSEARALGAEFLAKHPESPMAERVRVLTSAGR